MGSVLSYMEDFYKDVSNNMDNHFTLITTVLLLDVHLTANILLRRINYRNLN